MRRIALPIALLLTACQQDAGDSGGAATSSEPSTTAPTDASETGSCEPNPADAERYVIVGFWVDDDTCSGNPTITNAFPVSAADGCYCWPGSSGENSADSFSCDTDAQTFSYTQYNSLTCGEDDDTPTLKTVSTDACTQDIPPTLHAKIVDYGACSSS
jgi:hypothetical protein